MEANVEFYWIIPNWHQLQSDINSVLEHVQEFHLVSSKGLITSKWLLGFISIAAKETCVHPFIKLLATDGDCVCKGSVSLARLDKGEIFCQQLIVSWIIFGFTVKYSKYILTSYDSLSLIESGSLRSRRVYPVCPHWYQHRSGIEYEGSNRWISLPR